MTVCGNSNEGAPRSAPFLVLAWAGLAGAAGVSLAAVAAHKVDSPALATAATMLVLHAAAALAIAAIAMRAARPCVWIAAGLLMLAAASLFAGEIAFHTLTGDAAFQWLAPVGGTGMILSWLVVAAIAIWDRLRGPLSFLFTPSHSLTLEGRVFPLPIQAQGMGRGNGSDAARPG